jgi:hypothetical protein
MQSQQAAQLWEKLILACESGATLPHLKSTSLLQLQLSSASRERRVLLTPHSSASQEHVHAMHLDSY